MRDRSLDILKGISIIAIMLLHYEQGIFPEWLNTWIGSFMVAAFYMTAGWVLALKPLPDISTACRKLWHSLGIPYVTFSILICCFTALMCLAGWMKWEILLRDIWKFFTLRGIGTLWFLPALFCGEILFLYFQRCKITGKLLLFILICVYLSRYESWFAVYREQSVLYKLIDAPLNALSRICCAGISITVNYHLSLWFRSELEQKSRLWLLFFGVVILIFYTALILGGIRTDLGLGCSIWGPWGLLLLIRGSIDFPIHRIFEYFGKNSLIVMALHFSIIQQICILLNQHFTGNPRLYGWSAFAYFAVSVLLLVPCIILVRRYPFLLTGHFPQKETL